MNRKLRKSRNREIKSFVSAIKRIGTKSVKASDAMRNVAAVMRNAADFIDTMQKKPKLPMPTFATGGIVHAPLDPKPEIGLSSDQFKTAALSIQNAILRSYPKPNPTNGIQDIPSN